MENKLILKCKQCGEEYKTYNSKSKYCSHKCANVGSSKQRQRRKKYSCKVCGKQFEITLGEVRYREKFNKIQYCSQKCMGLSIKNGFTLKCKQCGENIYRPLSRIKRYKNHFCSVECSRKYYKENPPGRKKGYWMENGYMVAQENGKPKKVHRSVMEKHIGRKLNRKEIIHHKDKNPRNNNIDNLEIMSQSDHMSFHRNENKGEL